jgi:RNA polymerase sigma-70 factor (ECF subfamily)
MMVSGQGNVSTWHIPTPETPCLSFIPLSKLQTCVMLVQNNIANRYKNHHRMTMQTRSDTLDPAQWLAAHGDYLYRFAMKHLHNTALAEDAVQDTLLAALKAKDKYGGGSSVRTWLTGILKHKIVDIIRKQSREAAYPGDTGDGIEQMENLDKILFDARGEWTVPQTSWGNPESVLEQERFWHAFTACLDDLPPKLAQLFSLRELSGLQTAELCEAMNITSSNVWVILHRARLALKECLEGTWLKEPAGREA